MNDLDRLWNYYALGRLSRPRPRYLCVNATLRCDGRCGHCGIWRDERPTPELSAPDFGRLLGAPFFSRIETAWITGGEPTLREDLGELAQAMVGALPSLQTLGLATNALEPDRALDRVRTLAAAIEPARQSLFIHISLDGIALVHDRVRHREGAFAAVMETITRLRALQAETPAPKIELGLNCVIQPANLEHLPELFEFARERGLPLLFNVALVTDQSYRNLASRDALLLSTEERKIVSAFLERIIPKSPAPFQYQYRIMQAVLAGRARPRRCLTLYSTININADGSWIPCPAAAYLLPKNFREAEAEEFWKSEEAQSLRDRVHREFCPSCMLSCSLGDSLPLSEWLRGGWDQNRNAGKGG